MAREVRHEGSPGPLRRAAACAVLALGCAHTPLEPARSILDASSFVAPRPFRATLVRDAGGRAVTLPPTRFARSAVESFRVPEDHPLYQYLGNRSFVYDDALALIAALALGHFSDARALGETLQALISPRGEIGFSVQLGEEPFYDREYVRAGVMAWAGYALARFDLETGEHRFREAAGRIADTLLASRLHIAGDPRSGLILAGRGRWTDHFRTFDTAFTADYCVAEHQFDTYFLLRTLARVEPENRRWADEAHALAVRIDGSLWLPEGRFATAVTERGPVGSPALDAAGAWGALYLVETGDFVRAHAAMRYVRERFPVHVEGLDGFAPFHGGSPDHPGVDFSNMLSAEGTAGVALALLRLGERGAAQRLATSLAALQGMSPSGVLYAYPGDEEFPELPSVASTAWLLFLQLELAGRPATVFAPPPARAVATP